MSNARRPTIDDVARLAGVSRSAVSRSNTPGAYASASTVARVREAAQALGYRPNLLARSLSTRRSRVVAVAISRLENSFHAELLQSLTEGLQALGLRSLLFLVDRGDGDPPMDEVLAHQPAAILLCAVRLSSRFAEECRATGVPVVLINRLAEGGGLPAVTGDNMRGGQTVAAFLLAAGHGRLAFMAGTEESSTSREREAGFAAMLPGGYMRVAGLFDTGHATAAMRDLLGRRPRPDAVFCANDHMAMAAMDVARGEFGLAPGRDISIVGFDDARPAGLAGYGLTSFSQPATEMAEAAVHILSQMLEGGVAAEARVVVPGELVVRGSARLPAAGLSRIGGRVVWRMTSE